MLIWLIPFLAIIGVSFVLAFFSMRDFPDRLEIAKAGVFLIRNPENLTQELLETFRKKFISGEIISFERLFKGSKSALVVFGPRALANFLELNLLELEDYVSVDPGGVTAWEVALKGNLTNNVFEDLPELEVDDQFWWQLTLRATQGQFQTEIRSVVLAPDDRRLILAAKLQSLAGGQLVKQPRPLTSTQILINYQKRTILPLAKDQLILKSDQIFKLLGKV